VQVLKSDKFKDVTLGQYLKRGWYSRVFCSKYLLPMCAAIWSVPTASVLEFPVQVCRLSANPESRLAMEPPGRPSELPWAAHV
jgi:predicted NAD/FAD-binding protein